MAAVEAGKAAVAVVTREFEALARSMAANAGRPGLRVHVLPYPFETLAPERIGEIAREHYPGLLRTLGARE